ncbi:MAG: hypothetical protein WAZ98_12630 [Cyclobacteriaceae bacterium]
MKTKIIILLAISAVVTLSFTFASTAKQGAKSNDIMTKEIGSEPAGGFVSEDKF